MFHSIALCKSVFFICFANLHQTLFKPLSPPLGFKNRMCATCKICTSIVFLGCDCGTHHAPGGAHALVGRVTYELQKLSSAAERCASGAHFGVILLGRERKNNVWPPRSHKHVCVACAIERAGDARIVYIIGAYTMQNKTLCAENIKLKLNIFLKYNVRNLRIRAEILP